MTWPIKGAPCRGMLAVLLGASFFFLSVGACLSGPVLVIEADQQFAFAQEAFVDQEYYRAVSEFRRFLHFFPQDPRAPLAMLRIGQAYFNGQEYDEAQKALDALALSHGNAPEADAARLLSCQCLAMKEDFEGARACLGQAASTGSSQETVDQAWCEAAWIYIREGQWDMASKTLAGLSGEAKDRCHAGALVSELDKAGSLKQKEPAVAGVLAAVPGLGHVYLGRYQDAAIAFVLNGALAYGAYESFDNGQEGLGALITLVGFGFYAGNIYSAVSGADKHNRRQKADYIRRLEKYRVNISVGPTAHGAAASVILPF